MQHRDEIASSSQKNSPSAAIPISPASGGRTSSASLHHLQAHQDELQPDHQQQRLVEPPGAAEPRPIQ